MQARWDDGSPCYGGVGHDAPPEIAPGRVGAVTVILIALGVLGTFPPVWALLRTC